MRDIACAALGLLLAMGPAEMARGQEVVDRIAARVENDVILLSEVRVLGRYQLLVDGKSESDAALLDRLVDQWVVRSEANASHFPQPSEAEVDKGVERLEKSFASPADFQERKKQSGLSDGEVREMEASQLYLSSYLDSRFRPSVQVDAKAIEGFYTNGVLPAAKARGQEPPTLEASREYIQEALVQQGINEQADRWLKESRGRIHVERFLPEAAK